MTKVKERAVELINRMSDEKVMAVIAFVQNLQSETTSSASASSEEKDLAERHAAFDGLMKIIESSKKSLPVDFNYKEEWHKHLDEKYGIVD